MGPGAVPAPSASGCCARAGALLVTTPNRITFSPGRDTPLNPFHTRELSAAELAELLRDAGFADVEVLGLHHGPRLRALDAAHGGSLIDAQVAVARGAGGAWPARAAARRRRAVDAPRTSSIARRPDVDASLDLRGRGAVRAHEPAEAVGTFCLVLHSHLPWLAHHGRWPVGEEWLYQAWAHAYLPVARPAASGSPPRAGATCSPSASRRCWPRSSTTRTACAGMHDWLGGWQLRAHGAAAAAARPRRARAPGGDRARWSCSRRAGGTAGRRCCARWSTPAWLELLGGPATHPFQPLLQPEVRAFALGTGLDDAGAPARRAPAGIWAPECGYAPGMEDGYAAAGVQRFLVDGPALRGDTALARPGRRLGRAGFGRDLEVTYRVWSPRSGYPGGRDYRDFHTFDHPSGLKPARVTGRRGAAGGQAALRPGARRRGRGPRRRGLRRAWSARGSPGCASGTGGPALTVAAFDTELFGHWWHEGPAWLEAVLRALPEAGVRVTTLRGAADAGLVGAPVDAAAVVVGVGQGLAGVGRRAGGRPRGAATSACRRRCSARRRAGIARDPVRDALAPEALLALSSDWAFMVSKDSAADYARGRAPGHAARVEELAGLLARSRGGRAPHRELVAGSAPAPFGHLDARALLGPRLTTSRRPIARGQRSTRAAVTAGVRGVAVDAVRYRR